MDKVKLKVLGLSYSMLQPNAYALILGDETDCVRIPIVIGTQEAQSIAMQLEKLQTQRPMTHDIIKILTSHLNVELKEVNIYRLESGVFYSELLFESERDIIRIDSRTSDAIALALRYECPIFTTPEIIEKAGIQVAKQEEKPHEESVQEEEVVTEAEKQPELSVKELKLLMEDAIQKEDYEAASKYRDILNEKTKDQNTNN